MGVEITHCTVDLAQHRGIGNLGIGVVQAVYDVGDLLADRGWARGLSVGA